MGEVLLADDALLGRRVAIKRSCAPEHDGPYGRSLRREARIASRIAHRAIVQVFDLVHDGADHLVMEHVAGPSLARIHDGGRVDPVEAVRIAIELAAALAAVHERGTLHLDVKLENVLLTADGQPKLTDFGIARCESEVEVDAEPATRLAGTPRIMSAEQIRGDALDARSDLYSLGVLVFELLSGTSPFAAATELQTLSRALGDVPPRVDELAPAVPAVLVQLVADLLEKHPPLRPQTAVELQARLWAIAAALG